MTEKNYIIILNELLFNFYFPSYVSDKTKTKSKHNSDGASSPQKPLNQQSQGVHIKAYGFADNILKQIENLCYEATEVKDNNQSIITINEQLIDKYIISKIICIGTICKNCKYMFHNNYNIYKHMLDCRTNSTGSNDSKSVGIIKILKYNYYCMICKYYYFNNLNEFYLHFNNVHKNMILNNNNDEDKNDKNSGSTTEKVLEMDKGANIGGTNSNRESSLTDAIEKNNGINSKDDDKNIGNMKVDDPIENEVNEIVDKITSIASTEIGQR